MTTSNGNGNGSSNFRQLMATSNGSGAIQQLQNVGRDLRSAISAALPCAYEQYLTISMPGRVIDTELGGEFILPKSPSSGDYHQIKVKEARLVDSMIPLDTMMLGPTGKSVARSYLAALDALVPIEVEVALPDIDPKTKVDPGSISQYKAAMDYLRKPINGSQGPKTIVDIYVEKQKLYTEAQIAWDSMKDQNREDINAKGKRMTAAEMEKKNSSVGTLKMALNARWMDWVVNGDKVIVDHHFAIVDISTVMARIEASKSTARSANIVDMIDGSEWCEVNLAPENWAQLCRDKALAWAERNPMSPAVIEIEIKRLERLLVVYRGFKTFADETTGKVDSSQTPTTEDVDTATKYAAVNKAQYEYDESKRKSEDANNKDKEADAAKLPGLEKALTTAKQELKTALAAQASKVNGVVDALRNASDSRMGTSVKETIADIENQIKELRARLTASNSSFRRTVNPIIGIKEIGQGADATTGTAELELIRAKDGESEVDSSLLQKDTRGKGPDPWTTISFETEITSSTAASSSSSISGGLSAKYSGWLASAEVSSSFASATQSSQQESESYKVSGSFSAILVQINRPWLHSELFHDYEIDTPPTAKLSPGAQTVKRALEGGSNAGLEEYGMFPAYPTAFIVAADTEIEVSCGSAFASKVINSVSTDSSLSVGYGPWSINASANLKTSNTNTNQRMEATSTGMKLSFQAPQIIGWVSEILPQLPRDKSAQGQGGLVGPPMNYFK